jgi:hypothetical protein
MTLSSSAIWMAIALGLSLLGLGGHAHAQPAPRFKAVAFDYFVIFDANSVILEGRRRFPARALSSRDSGAPSSSNIAICAPSLAASPTSPL